MNNSHWILVPAVACMMFAGAGRAQTAPPSSGKDFSNSRLVVRMMSFDKNNDGKLTRDEITDPRLVRLFDEADVNHDGVVTREELVALAAKLDSEVTAGGGSRDRGPGRGPGGGGPGGGGPGGGGPGGGGPPRFVPGEIIPPFALEALNLSAEQKQQMDALQAEVKEKLARILSPEQMKQLEQGGPPRGF